MLKLSYTTKMPGASFSLPAGFTCTSLCTVPCYAKKGFYRMPAARSVREENYETVLELLAAGKGTLAKELIRLIDEDRSLYFRIHDSGDFFLPEYVDEWIQVAEEMPFVRFWAPTKAWVLPDVLPKLREFNKLPNATIRPSGLGIYDSPPRVEGLAGGSSITSDRAIATCRSFDNDGKCGTCRLCWDVPFNAITYLRH